MIRDRSFQRMKQRDVVVEEMRKHPSLFSDRRVDNVADCANIEVVQRLSDGRLRTLYAHHCGDRACPICQKLKAQRASAWLRENDKVQRQKLEEAAGKTFTDEAWYCHYKFVTVSPFVSDFDLKSIGDKIAWLGKVMTNNGNYYFTQLTGVKPIGYWRTFEITYDPEKGFHPHIHCIYLYPERAPYVDQLKFERAIFKALKDSPYLGTLANGEPQASVSVDIRDICKKDTNSKGYAAAFFELSKYIAKVEDFGDDLVSYVRLAAAWGRTPQMRGSGVYAGYRDQVRYRAIVQNANCAKLTTKDDECVVFYGRSDNRVAYRVPAVHALQASAFFSRLSLREYNDNFVLCAKDEQRRWCFQCNPSGIPYAYYFDSGGLHVYELPPWSDQEESAYLEACRRSIAYSPDLGKTKRFRVASRKLSESLGYEQCCLMELVS